MIARGIDEKGAAVVQQRAQYAARKGRFDASTVMELADGLDRATQSAASATGVFLQKRERERESDLSRFDFGKKTATLCDFFYEDVGDDEELFVEERGESKALSGDQDLRGGRRRGRRRLGVVGVRGARASRAAAAEAADFCGGAVGQAGGGRRPHPQYLGFSLVCESG